MIRTPAEAFSVKVALVIIVLMVLVLNAGGFLIYHTASTYLDVEWGRRLESLASVVSLEVAAALRTSDSDQRKTLEDLIPWLSQVRDSTSLRSVFILMDPETEDFSGVGTDAGQVAILQDIDFFEIDGAWNGATTDSEFYKLGDSYYKRAYAPVLVPSDESPILVVGVEADSSLFTVLVRIRHTLFIVAAMSFILCFLFVPLVFRMTRSFVHLEEALARTENSMEMDQLAASVAHEIRNPLGIIQANAEVLLETAADQEQKEMLTDLLEETERLDRIMNGVLGKLSEPDSSHSLFDVRDSLIEGVEHFRQTLEDSNILMELNLPEEGEALLIRGDRIRFEGAMANLLRNSREAMAKGGRIDVGLENRPPDLRVFVRDTGKGIPRWSLKKVLLPFYSEKERGTGLGLPTVRRIVREMGGSLSIKSAKGKGTEVSMALPKAKDKNR